MLRGGKSSEFTPIPAAELSKYVFGFRATLLFLLCVVVRGARVCKLRRGVFGLADSLWITLDVFLSANPLWRLPQDPGTHLGALFRSTRWSLFLFCGVPLFVAAAERQRRGLAVLVVVCMTLQRSTAALLTHSPDHVGLAILALRPMWLAASMIVGARPDRRRGDQHVV